MNPPTFTFKKMIEEITKDIRAYQKAEGALVVFDPNSEAYTLCDLLIRLRQQAV